MRYNHRFASTVDQFTAEHANIPETVKYFPFPCFRRVLAIKLEMPT